MERKLFYRPRPIRIWYIFDSSVPLDDIKKIMQLSFKYLWWRYNQFFFLENNNFTQKDYERLRQFDADIYVALCDIADELKDVILRKFSPLEIIPRDKFEIWEQFLEFHGWYLNKPPRFIYWDQFLLDRKYRFINFVCEDWIETAIKDFISLNFWYSKSDYNSYFNLLTHNIHIRNKKDIVGYFNEIDDASEYLFLNTFSQLSFCNMRNDIDDELITIVIWNSLQDYLYFWNNNDLNSEDEVIKNRIFILPIDNIKDKKDLIESMITFIRKYILTYYSYKIVIKSFSFSEQDFQRLWFWEFIFNWEQQPQLNVLEKILRQKYSSDIRQWPYISLYDTKNVVNFNIQRFWNIKNWEYLMFDVFLEYSTGENVSNNFWYERWFLECNRNNNAYRDFFEKFSFFWPWQLYCRINNLSSFSILIRDNENLQDVTIDLKKELEILWGVMMYEIDDKPVKIENFKLLCDYNFERIKISKEWKSANSIFKLFWYDWTILIELLENNAWRDLFVEYNQTIKKDIAIDTIQKILDKDKDKESESLSIKIFNKINEEITYKDRYITLNQIFKCLWIDDKFIKKYNSNNVLSKWESFTDHEASSIVNIVTQVENLVNLGVLRQWVQFRCKSCWEKYWIPIWDTQEKNICRWCWTLNQLPIESEWTYSFNTMLKWSNIKWAFAVLHYLLKLREQYNWSAFMYGLWLECYENGGPLTDCDIVAIIGGRLFLSEVKYSWELLKKKDFDNIQKIAEKVKPDVIIFAAYWDLDKWKIKRFDEWSASLKKNLGKYGTTIHYAKIDLDKIISYPY